MSFSFRLPYPPVSMSAPADVVVYRTGARKVGQKNKAGQGLEALSFAAEHQLMNRAMARECECPALFSWVRFNIILFKVGKECLECTKVLSPAAKAVIREETQKEKYATCRDNLEPPFMAPSDNLDDYSIVCLFLHSADC